MSKRTSNRTGREAKRRRARHVRRAGQAAVVKAWLKVHAPGALIYARPQVCLRKLVRVALMTRRVHLMADGGFYPLRLGEVAELEPYRWPGIDFEMRLPSSRLVYLDGI